MYKKGQGMISRAGMACLSFLLGSYAGNAWYGWWFDSVLLAGIGGAGLFLGMTGLGLYLCFRSPGSSDYLIDMDGELRKVIWPAVQPLFDHKTEAWGSTYVVILCTFLLTFYIWIVDSVIQRLTEIVFPILFG